MSTKRKKAVRRVDTAKVPQKNAKLGGGKTKGCTGEEGRATPPNLGRVRKTRSNP